MALLDPIYNEQLQTAMLEGLVQNIDVLNQSSAGTILLGTEDFYGNYMESTHYDRIADMIERRDITSDAATTDKRMSLIEDVEVVIDYKSKILETYENFRRRGKTMEEFVSVVGRQFAEEFVKRHLNLMVSGLVAAVDNNTAMVDVTLKAATASIDHLLKADELFGEKYGEVSAYLMNASAFHKLRKDQADNYKIDNVAGVLVATGMSFSLGKPVIVSNIPSLTYNDGTNDLNRILALTPSAINMNERSGRLTSMQEVTDQENLAMRIAIEGSVKCGIKGYAWDKANGGTTPSDAAIATGTNWDLITSNELSAAALVEALK
tara:strand:- start:73774 stop:74736 length:963 start_codon:yes stop_codon:yes gene_type:complete